MKTEHPERLDVRIDARIAGDEEVDDDAAEDGVLDPRGAPFECARNIDSPLRRKHAIHQLRERTKRADAPAVDTSPQDRRDEGNRGEQIPRQAVAEGWQVAAEQAEDVDDGEQRALPDADVDH